MEIRYNDWTSVGLGQVIVEGKYLLSVDIDPSKFIDNDFYSFEGKRCKIKCLWSSALESFFTDKTDSTFFFKNFKQYQDNYEERLPEKTSYKKKWFTILHDNEALFSGVADYNSYNRDYANETIEFELVDINYILFENIDDCSSLKEYLDEFEDELNMGYSLKNPSKLVKLAIDLACKYPIDISARVNNNIPDVSVPISIQNKMLLWYKPRYVKNYINDIVMPAYDGSLYSDTVSLKIGYYDNNFAYIEYSSYVENISHTINGVLKQYVKINIIGIITYVSGFNNDKFEIKTQEIKLEMYSKEISIEEFESQTMDEWVEILLHATTEDYLLVMDSHLMFVHNLLNPIIWTTSDYSIDLNSYAQIIYVSSTLKKIEITGTMSCSYNIVFSLPHIIDGTVTSGIFNPDKFSLAEFIKITAISSTGYLTFNHTSTKLDVGLEFLLSKNSIDKVLNKNFLLNITNKQEIYLVEKALNELNFAETDRHFVLFVIKQLFIDKFFISGRSLKTTFLLEENVRNLVVGNFIQIDLTGDKAYLVNSIEKDYVNYTIDLELIEVNL